MSSKQPDATPTGRQHWLPASAGHALRLIVIAACIAIALLALRAWQAAKASPLQPWHTLAAEEPSAADILRGDWQAYIAGETALFARVRAELDAAMTPEDAHPLNRYTAGSLSAPDRFRRDWNRSFVLETRGAPRGVAVLVHGLTDAPYSMLRLATLYNAAGYIAIVPRMPGHGTVPGALVRAERSQWQAAVAVAMDEARRHADGRLPVHLVGYSNGGALALLHEVERLRRGQRVDADHLILLSPMIKVSAFARYAGLAGLPALLPRYARSAWSEVLPEYNPFKYNSFPVHAARESYLVTAALQDGLAALAADGRLSGLPPILAFQSVVDDTVDASAVDRLLFDKLATNRNELVLFDVNRNRLLQPLQVPATTAWADALLHGPAHAHAATMVGTTSLDDPAAVARTRPAGGGAVAMQPLGIDYPADVFSLSHIALPFAEDDALYGHIPREGHPLQLGAIALRGERNTLVVPQASLERLSYNPFHDYMAARITKLLAADRVSTASGEGMPGH
ncbi:alpha/beta hydrolase [Thermomonas carbonis]|uniref:Alpha/beta hydrolase n=1 Tax=Thermomonas carbonis TaxID=1463158 RepID=A0A7G9STW7_9GAMM|nr:alpha/beta hydrolase [Thermomonas carbonis]QNN71292.1 alpha/beta hydrolase [Thermomonas carbonis]GHC10597.1 membrane protein [Thermomonas carbonis]